MPPVPILAFLVLVASHVLCEPEADRSVKKALARDCASYYTITCLKLDVVTWVDRLSEGEDYSVLPGVSVVRENGSARASTSDLVAELAREFPNDPDARLDAFLLKKVHGYLNSHAIKLNLVEEGHQEEARKRKGGGGGTNGLLAAAALMKGTLFALALGGLAAIAGKALMTALISLLLSALAGLKGMGGGGGKSTTYEVITKPVYSHSNTHSSAHVDEHSHGYAHSGYGRSFEVPLPLGLQAGYKPAQ